MTQVFNPLLKYGFQEAGGGGGTFPNYEVTKFSQTRFMEFTSSKIVGDSIFLGNYSGEIGHFSVDGTKHRDDKFPFFKFESNSAYNFGQTDIYSIELDIEGNVVVSGSFAEKIVKFDSFGYYQPFSDSIPGSYVSHIQFDDQNRLLAIVAFTDYDVSKKLIRFLNNGSIDPNFVQYSFLNFNSHFEILPDGKILVGDGQNGLFLLNADGDLNSTFYSVFGGEISESVEYFKIDSLGRVYVSCSEGWFFRLLPNGTKDLSFNPPIFPNQSYSIVFVDEGVLISNYLLSLVDGSIVHDFEIPVTSWDVMPNGNYLCSNSGETDWICEFSSSDFSKVKRVTNAIDDLICAQNVLLSYHRLIF